MRSLITVIFAFTASLSFSQIFEDIAVAQGVNYVSHTFDNHGYGMSFYDFDEDGWDDLTIPANDDSVVFYRNVNGNFVKLPSMLKSTGSMRQISWIDYDEDGYLDLCASYYDIGVRLYRNNGSYVFTDVTQSVGIDITPFRAYGFSFADPDEDGDLDLYVSSYESPIFVSSPTPNRYYENQGNGTFIEMAGVYGIGNGLKTSFMGVWFDSNNDNNIDLHVINDRTPFADAHYLNDGNGGFTDVAAIQGIDNNGHFPMCAAISDFNNDGYFDVFKSDIADGTVQNGIPIDYKLYANQSGTGFNEVAGAMNLHQNSYAWGGLWVDFNNDCYEDLYVATSFIDTLSNPFHTSRLYRNNTGTGFTDFTTSIIGDITCSSYCPVKGDINKDGYYDIVVLNDNRKPNVLLNNSSGNNYIRITPVGLISNRMAIGAVIKVYANSLCQSQTVMGAESLCAQNSQHKIFGLGGAEFADSVIITFPSGMVVKKYALDAGNSYTISEVTVQAVEIIPTVDTLGVCYGDSAIIGVPGYYNYEWSNGETTPTIHVTSDGLYSFEATNLAGDTLYQSNALYVELYGQIVNQEVVTNTTCDSTGNGTANVIVPQPSLVDSISWSNGESGAFISGLSPGTYTYTITSIYGCTKTDSVTIGSTPLFDVLYVTTPATDQSLGSAQLSVWGAASPYVIIMDNDTVSSNITGLAPGTYQVTVIDANNCEVMIEFTIDDQTSAGLSENSNQNYWVYLSDGQLYVCMEDAASIEVTVIDMMGKEVLTSGWNSNGNCVHQTSTLPKGMYLVRISNGTSEFIKKLDIR